MALYQRTFKITKCNRQHHLHHRDWSSLPADILGDISSRLMFQDYNSFANVCTSWRSARGLPCPRMPVVFLHKYCFLAEPKPFCQLLNLTGNLSDNLHMPILGGKVCVGSQHGWLVLVDKTVGVISLYNPFTHQVIKMPSHAHLLLPRHEEDVVLNIRKVVLSSPPISSSAPLPAAVALLYGSRDVLYKRDGQSSWTCLVYDRRLQDVTWWRGKFVGITNEGGAVTLDLDVLEPKFEYMGQRHDFDAFMRGPTLFKTVDDNKKYHKHLVKLDDNLLQVWWYIRSQSVQTHSSRYATLVVKVMQLDPQSFTWFHVNDLCGHSLFIGASHSFALSSEHIPGLKDNLIYFLQDLDGSEWDPNIYRTDWKRDIRVFNFKTRTYEICVPPNTPFISSMYDDLCGHSTTSAFWYTAPLLELQTGSF